MERSRKWMPMVHRSKGICVIALAVGFGCAVIGVGGAGAGDGAYVHHLQQVRLENLALAHRSPEQLVLAVKPKLSSDSTTTAATTATGTTTSTTASTTPGSTDAAATTTGTTTTPTTATGTTATTATTTTPTTTTDTTTTPGTTTGPTTTPGTTTTAGTTTTGATTTPGTTTTGTSTTSTTTTPGTTGTTTTTATDTATTGVNGRQPGTTVTTTTPVCHGRCSSSTGTSGVVPASLPSTTSSSSSGNFSVTTGTATPTLVTVSAPVNAASTSTLIPVSTSTQTPTSTPTSGTGASTPAAITPLTNPFSSSGSAIQHLSSGSGSHRSGAGALPTTGTATAAATGTAGTGPAGTTGTGTAAAGSKAAGAHTPAHHSDKHPTTGDSAFTSPFSSSVHYIDRFVNVIPTAVWVALGAAFALMLAFAAAAFRSGRRARRRENEFAAISAAALTDALTGILNRRGFTEAAERELARASRYDRPFVLAYVDVRGLKAVNDTEGHLMGDELIKTVAGLMKESARADDVAGRIGGDEFALLLAEQTGASAEPVIHRIQTHVAEARAAMEISVPWELTIGMAAFPSDGATLDELLDVADRRLYEQRGIALR